MTAPLWPPIPYGTRQFPRYEHRVRVRLEPWPFPFVVLTLIGFALGAEVQFKGTLYIGEILLAMFAFFGVFLNLGNGKFWTQDLYRFLTSLVVSYLAYILTDLYVGTPTTNLLRGWARMGFLITDTLGIYVICRRNRYNLFPMILGLALAAFLLPHQETLRGNFAFKWKIDLYFSWISSVCVLAVLLGRCRPSVFASLLLIPAGVVSILLDARIVGAACIIVPLVLLSRSFISRRQRNLLIVVLALAVSVAAGGTYYLLNETNQEHGDRRLGSNLARATAILTAIQQIAQNPFLGTGSWNVNETHMNRHRANTVTLGGKRVSTGMALGHSQILQAAVEAGIFGSAFFAYFLICLIRSFWWTVKRPLDRFSAFALLNLLLCTWHNLFSAQGGSQRIEIATGVFICLLMARERKQAVQAIASGARWAGRQP